MKKRVFLFILSCLLLSAMALAFSACGKVECTVSFMVDDAVYATITTDGKEALKMPGDPAKEGLVFDGWYWDKDSWQKPFTAGSLLDAPLSETLTVYARFKEKPLSGTEISAPGYTVDGKSYSISVPSTTEQYSFIDVIYTANDTDFTVCTDMECTNSIPSKTTQLVRGDNVFYILVTNGKLVDVYTFTVRRRPVYTVSFQTNGSAIPSMEVDEGSLITEPPAPTREGYTFTGWNFDFSAPITGNTVITANWRANTYTVTLDAAGSSVSETTQIVTFGAYVNLPVPTKEYYKFLGWYHGDTKVEGAWRIASDVTLTARWLSCFKITSDGTITGLREFDETLTDLVIPRKIDDITVTIIGARAFYGCTGLATIIIPSSVTYIGWAAFYGCTSLTSVTIPDDITHIGEDAFYNCPIESATIPALACSFVVNKALKTVLITSGTRIGGNAFSNCKNLTSITIPNSVTSIGDNVFYGCANLMSITVDEGNTKYHSAGNCLIETATRILIAGCKTSIIPMDGSVTSIGNYAFYGCTSLTSITIPDSVTSIGWLAFNGCMSLTSIKVDEKNTEYHSEGNCLIETATKTLIVGCKTSIIPTDGSVTSIGNYAFLNCTSLTSIAIPNSVTSIEADAFYGCTSLTSITIPNSVTSIGDFAFYGCTSLTSIIIGNGLTSIGSQAFDDCFRLVEVYNLSTLTIKKGSDANGYVGRYALVIHTSLSEKSNLFTDENGFAFYEDGENCYLLGYTGNETVLILPQSCHGKKYAIYQYAFYNCTSLTSITLPNGVTSIGGYVFCGCMSLTSIAIPNSVTSIGDYAFCGCMSLTSIAIPNSVTSIGNYAFSGCTNLTSITISDSVTSIKSWAFSGCTSLTSIHFQGTKAEWNQINKRDGWNYNTGNYTVHCTDGDIAKQ